MRALMLLKEGYLVHELGEPRFSVLQHLLSSFVLLAFVGVFEEGDRQGSISAVTMLPDGLLQLLSPLCSKFICKSPLIQSG